MPKFFIEKNSIINGHTVISGGDAAHIAKVLRLSAGDALTLCDGQGTDFSAVITDLYKDRVELNIIEAHPCLAEPELAVTLFQALPKQGKMDFIIEKCTELGIGRIVPVSAHRCVAAVRDAKAEEKKLARWRKIAAESVKQCGRGVIPEVPGVVPLPEAILMAGALDVTFAAYENERDMPLKSVLEAASGNGKPKSLGFFIGPEGGFESEEIASFSAAGIPAVTLGKRILRTETAGCAVLTAVMYAFGELS